ncbi:MAG: thioredoxin family protein [Firmicutes bacterium]|nr:thioredoxin family protein [Bacillota bacterium]MCM1402000.1 thioredoxin family protein [Bacteroides sp.]MCM1476895.1 thioredoxin family protein [Bacteroides sp.]
MNRPLKLLLAVLLMLLASAGQLYAQIVNPVKWSREIGMSSATEGSVTITASIDNGWHIYGLDLPEGGPRATQIEFSNLRGATLQGPLTASPDPVKEYDSTFKMDLSWWNTAVTFTQRFKLDEGSKGCAMDVKVSYQACSTVDKTCIAPAREQFELSWGTLPEATSEATDTDSAMTDTSAANSTSEMKLADTWAPVEFGTAAVGNDGNVPQVKDASWLYIFVWGFLGGLVALLTPCVWPMIPLTVSFFLKKSQNRRRAIADALTYGAAIIVIFLVLGLAVTALFGAGKLNELATNAVFNIIFFLLLVVFAVSFFGAFEIKLPASWSNRMDSNADRTTGMLSIFFMAFTLVLVSFSCTGPIIGTLLVEAASQGSIAGPAVGMGAFALALSIPFTLCAIFPSLLKDLPRSGGWLNSVKVVLGFLELALSLKFLSVADLAYGWGMLDREVFLSLWIVIFALLGFYLLGKLRFSHDAETPTIGVGRFFLALVSLSFTVYLVPGLWGAPLKGVSAFVPPLYTQDFNLYGNEGATAFDDYDKGMEFAARNHKPVLIDFSGYGCVNCRKMEGAVFDTERVSSLIANDFVMITLMVDDKHKLPESLTVTENGRKVILETVGDKWGYLQRSKFNASVQPYYVILDNSGRPLAPPRSYNENVDRFVEWLQSGLENYSKVKNN